MKSFSFRLESALRWRTAQVDLEQNRAAATAARLNSIRSAIDLRRKEISGAAATLTQGALGAALQSWGAWVNKCNREIRDLERHAQSTEQTLAANLRSLVQANQNRQLIAKLKQSALSHWNAEASRELEAFAGEAFLRQVTIGKRTGA